MNKLIGIVKVLFVVLVILSMTAIGGVAAVYYENWERDMKEQDSELAQFLSGNKKEEKVLEPNLTCLVMGRNQSLTDFIILAQYNPNTREAALLSIPRDSFVAESSPDGKINSIYANYGGGVKGITKLKEKVEEMTGIEIQHYVLFDASMLKKVVNELGGVTVDVPINMNYDDIYQTPELHIHLKKGTQLLSGSQAEQFVRFRKNNDGTGYPNGDIGRIAAQQSFIKALITEVLKAENLGKAKTLAQIVIDNTKTDITMELVEEYLDELVTFKVDRMRLETLPGVGKYQKYNGLTRSYYILNEESGDILIDEMFNGISSSGDDTSTDEVASGNNSSSNTDVSSTKKEVFSTSLEEVPSGESQIKVELLNAKAKTSRLTELAETLADNEYNVVKLGNYQTVEVETSRIITYGQNTDEELKKLKEVTGIKKVVESTDASNVKFTIIIGANY